MGKAIRHVSPWLVICFVGACVGHEGKMVTTSERCGSMQEQRGGHPACCSHSGVITPNQYEGSDIQRIQAAINAAKGRSNMVVIPAWNARGTNIWSVDSAILLPSKMTLVLDNCTIKLSDKCRDNMFRSDNVGIGITAPKWNHNISIIGVGNVNLYGADNPRATGDGAKRLSLTPDEDRKRLKTYHISYGTDAGKVGEKQTSDWRNIMILMAYVKGFSLRDVNIHYPHGWSISCERTWNADISGIRFNNPGTRFINGQYRRTLNPDGINLRHGCRNFRIADISGYIEEDCIAISSLGTRESHGSLDSSMVSPSKWQGPDDDTEQVFIFNIHTGITGVAIYAAGKAGIRNVFINGVAAGLPHGLEGQHLRTIFIGTSGYGALSEPGRIRDIYAMNFTGSGKNLIQIDAPIANCHFMNGILRNGGEAVMISDRVKGKTRNVIMTNIVNSPGGAPGFDRNWILEPFPRPGQGEDRREEPLLKEPKTQ
jgi:hypothetical protein